MVIIQLGRGVWDIAKHHFGSLEVEPHLETKLFNSQVKK